MNDLISVIVPVYNVKEYLSRCITSLLRQTVSNFEILIIDDGSTDGSESICDSYKNRPEILVFHKANGGLSDARNFGIDHAKGNLLTFIDSDDYVADNYLQTLYAEYLNNHSEIIISDLAPVFDSQDIPISSPVREVLLFNQQQSIEKSLTYQLTESACGKLYSANLFKQIRFPVGKLYEDVAVVYDLLLKSQKVSHIVSNLYLYTRREGSIMNSSFSMNQTVEMELIDCEMNAVLGEYPELLQLTIQRRINSYFNVLRRVLLGDKKRQYKDISKDIRFQILDSSSGVWHHKDFSRNIKIKILLLKLGMTPYIMAQKISDKKYYQALKFHNATVIKEGISNKIHS